MRLICSKFFSFSPYIIFGVAFFVLSAVAFIPAPVNASCACTCVFNKGSGVIPATAIPGYKDENACTVACQATALGNSASGWTYNTSACLPEAAMEAAKAEDKKEAEAKAEASSGSSASGSSSKPAASTPPAVPTEKLCECFCSTSGGAKDAGKKSSIACQTECKKGGNMGVAACAYSLAQYPSQSLYCFTDEQCTKQNGDPKLSKQAPECVSGQKYCYPDPSKAAKIKLNVAIGGLTLVGDLATYINTAYSWMLGAGVTIAIVLAMVGGLQYVLSSGGAKVGDAKKRITNALIGLILLLCVNLILQTVNPYLLTMQVPKLPMIKKVILISGAVCEDLAKNGFQLKNLDGKDIESDKKQCGNSAKVVKDKDGKAVADGTTCDFRGGCGAIQTCVGFGEKAKCLSCAGAMPSKDFTPSAGVCSQLTPKVEYGTIANCGYSTDQDLVKLFNWDTSGVLSPGQTLSSFAASATGGFIGHGLCGYYKIDCSAIIKSDKPCEQYNNVDVSASGKTVKMLTIQSENGNFGLYEICQSDPCHISQTQGTKSEDCILKGKGCMKNNKMCIYNIKDPHLCYTEIIK